MTTDIEAPDGLDGWESRPGFAFRFSGGYARFYQNGLSHLSINDLAKVRDYCLHAAREYPAVMKRVKELESLVRDFAECEVEYMRINNLGDGEKQHNVKRARALLESRT